MRITKNTLVVITCCALLGIFNSCQNTTELQNQYNSLFEEVIAVHDEIMPKMTQLSKLQLQIKTDTLIQVDTKDEALKKLQASDDRMMTWMHTFTDEYVKDRKPVSKMSQTELENSIEGLHTELEEVESLREFTYSSIDLAEEILNN